MSFPAYPSYRESGVEWLGEVPANWECTQVRYVASLNPSKSITNELPDEFEVAFLPMESIGAKGTIDLAQTRALGDVRNGYSYFANGDIVIAKVTPCFENGKGAPIRGLQSHHGFGTTELIVLRPHRPENQDFLWWLTASTAFRLPAQAEMVGAGGLKRVPDQFVAGFPLAWPDAAERRAIATFLDSETARIDALIEEQQRMIDLLKEKRQAVISHAVTKGLDPTAPMKDSGVEWLGEVPAHWQLAPLKRDLAFLTSGSRGWADHYVDDGALFIRIGNLTRDSIDVDLSDIQMVEVPTGSEGERTRVRPGDVLFSITAFLGSVAVIPDKMEEAYVSQHVALARPSNRYFLPDWIGYVTLSYLGKTQLEVGGYGGTKVQLSLGDVGDLLISAPPLAEQVTIVHALEGQLRRLSLLSCEAQIAVEILQERRSALISAAVTGKIDVRGVLKPKPEFESSSYADL